jgi:hypothetical protein
MYGVDRWFSTQEEEDQYKAQKLWYSDIDNTTFKIRLVNGELVSTDEKYKLYVDTEDKNTTRLVIV